MSKISKLAFIMSAFFLMGCMITDPEDMLGLGIMPLFNFVMINQTAETLWVRTTVVCPPDNPPLDAWEHASGNFWLWWWQGSVPIEIPSGESRVVMDYGPLSYYELFSGIEMKPEQLLNYGNAYPHANGSRWHSGSHYNDHIIDPAILHVAVNREWRIIADERYLERNVINLANRYVLYRPFTINYRISEPIGDDYYPPDGHAVQFDIIVSTRSTE